MIRPRLGVVIVNWNGRDHLVPCLDSLFANDYPISSVVVVDNGSVDGSASAAKHAYPLIHVIVNDTNLGFAKSNNLGARYLVGAGCDVILFLNNDTLLRSDALGALVSAAEIPNVVIVNPLINDREGRVWFSGARLRRWRGDVVHDHLQMDPDGHPRITGSGTGCAMLVTADCARRMGPFDERYFIYWEDADLSARVHTAGGLIVVAPAARVIHKVSADSLRNAPTGFFYYLNTRNRLLFTRSHLPTLMWWIFVSYWTILYILPTIAVLVAIGKFAKGYALWCGYSDYFRGRFGPPRIGRV